MPKIKIFGQGKKWWKRDLDRQIRRHSFRIKKSNFTRPFKNGLEIAQN